MLLKSLLTRYSQCPARKMFRGSSEFVQGPDITFFRQKTSANPGTDCLPFSKPGVRAMITGDDNQELSVTPLLSGVHPPLWGSVGGVWFASFGWGFARSGNVWGARKRRKNDSGGSLAGRHGWFFRSRSQDSSTCLAIIRRRNGKPSREEEVETRVQRLLLRKAFCKACCLLRRH